MKLFNLSALGQLVLQNAVSFSVCNTTRLCNTISVFVFVCMNVLERERETVLYNLVVYTPYGYIIFKA